MTATSTSTSAEATIGDEMRRAAEEIALPSGADQPDTETVMASICCARIYCEISSARASLLSAVHSSVQRFPTRTIAVIIRYRNPTSYREAAGATGRDTPIRGHQVPHCRVGRK